MMKTALIFAMGCIGTKVVEHIQKLENENEQLHRKEKDLERKIKRLNRKMERKELLEKEKVVILDNIRKERARVLKMKETSEKLREKIQEMMTS